MRMVFHPGDGTDTIPVLDEKPLAWLPTTSGCRATISYNTLLLLLLLLLLVTIKYYYYYYYYYPGDGTDMIPVLDEKPLACIAALGIGVYVSLSLSLYIYILCICIYIYIYTYVQVPILNI